MASKLTKFGLCVSFAVLLAACDSQSPQQKVEALQTAASEHVAAGQYDAAVIELKNAVQIRPDAADLRLELGRLYIALGDGASAQKELDRASTLGLDAPELLADRMMARLLRQDVAGALALAPQAEPGTALPAGAGLAPYAVRARALAVDGQLPQAVELALAVLNRQDHADARLALAAVAAQRGDARNMLVQAQSALAMRPEDVDGLWLLAVAQTNAGDKAEARATLERLRQAHWRPIRADLLTVQLALDAGDEAAAWKVLDALEKTNGKHPEVQFYVAMAALQRGEPEKARLTAETLLGRYPQFDKAAFVAGAANLELGNYVLARDHLERYLRAQPDDNRAKGMLAHADAEARADAGRQQQRGERPGRHRCGRRRSDRPRQIAAIADGEFDANGLQNPELPADGEPDAEAVRARVTAILEMVSRGEIDAAREAVEALKAAMPDSATPRELSAIVRWRAGDQDAAIAEMDALHQEDPTSVARATNLSQMHRAVNAPEAALAAIQRAFDAGASHIRLHGEAARAYAMMRDTDGMAEQFRAALALEPDNLRVRTVLAQFHLQQGQAQEVIDMMQTAPAEAADDPGLIRLHAQAYLNLGRVDDAVALLRHLTDRLPEDPTAHQQLGQVLLAAGRPGPAVPPLTTARVLSGDAREPSLQLGRALLESGAGDKAGDLVADLAAAYPQDPDVQVLVGNHAMSVARDPDAAEAAFKRALEIDPNEARLSDLVQALNRMGRLDAASRELEAWRAAHPASERVEATLGEIYIASGRMQDAAPVYEGLIQRAPDTAAYRNNLAWILKQQGRFAAAQEQVQWALKMAPEDPNVLDTAGTISLQLGDVPAALAYLSKAASAAPGNPEIQINYAEALLSADDEAAARDVLAAVNPAGLPARLTTRFDQLKRQSAE
ncbi:MAG: tetratricopeptide repeat protein [Rhodovibrio sp.]|nr:tetratricopeptide repeat protein [Rhodovibrio sp.]